MTQPAVFPQTRHLAPALAACMALSVMAPAAAQSTAAADELFNEGRSAMDRRDYEVACAKFRESDRLDPAPGTMMNLANCEEQRGRIATAWALFTQVLERLEPGDTRVEVVKQRVDALAVRAPRLRVTLAPGAPTETRVRVGTLELSSSRFGSSVPIDPGRHTVVVTIPGRSDEHTTIELTEGATAELIVPLAFRSNSALPVAPRPEASSQRSGQVETGDRVLGLDRTTAGWVLGSVGAAGLLVGTITGIVGLNKEAIGDANCSDSTRTCNQRGFDANSSARSLATVSVIGFAVGIGAGGAATYLFLTTSPSGGDVRTTYWRETWIGWRGTW